MAYERSRTVKDGDDAVTEDDIQGRDATKGVLVHARSTDKKARPLVCDEDGVKTSDVGISELLEEIRDELKEIRMYMKIMVE